MVMGMLVRKHDFGGASIINLLFLLIGSYIYCADVVGASYYDSSLRWFENINGTGMFTEHMISDAVREGQGVTLADLDK